MLRLKNSWFNPVYFHIRHYTEVPTIRKIMVYGGKSSAKTVSIAQLFLIVAFNKGYSSISFRKEQTTIKTTIKQAFKKSIDLLYLTAAFEEMDFKFRCKNEADCILKGLDEESKVKGVEGYKYLLFDELDHFESDEWKQANASLRGMENQKLFATWNPVDEKIWIKTELDQYTWTDLPLIIGNNEYSRLSKNASVKISNDGKIILIKTTYFDNKWMVGGDGFGFRDQNLIDEYERNKLLDENWYRVNVLGEWGITNKQKKFAWAFDDKKHTQPAKDNPGLTRYNPEHISWITFDFNVNPMTATIIQHYDEVVRCIECIKLENSNTWEMCRVIKAKYPDAIFKVTGDATGYNRNTMSPDNVTNYQIIQQVLNLNDTQIIVPVKNPNIEDNQILVNAVLANYAVYFSELCQPLIYDLTYVEMNHKKEIIKDRTSDKKYADFLDNFRYFINVEFDLSFIHKIK